MAIQTTETKIFNALKKFKGQNTLDGKGELQQVLTDLDEPVFMVDYASICYIEALSKTAKMILINFQDEDRDYPKGLINQIKEEKDTGITLSVDYLNKIMNLLKITDEKVKIYAPKNMPSMFENKDFRIILAPRLDEEEIEQKQREKEIEVIA